MNESFVYLYQRIKAILAREKWFILTIALGGGVMAAILNYLVRKSPNFKATTYLMATTSETGVSVLDVQMGQNTRRMPPSIEVLTIKTQFPDFYRGLKDTALMYEVLEGRIERVNKLKPGVYTSTENGVIGCPCSKKFKVVIYDTLSLWDRLARGRVRIVEGRSSEPTFGPKNTIFFTVEYVSPDKRWARRASEVVAHWIILKHLEEKKQSLIRQRETIRKLMDFYRKEIDIFARQIQKFKEKMKYPEFTEEGILKILSNLKERERALEKLVDVLKKQPEDTLFVDVGESALNDLQSRRISILLKMWELESIYGKKHPQVVTLRRTLKNMNSLILGSAQKSLRYIQEQVAYYRGILPDVMKEEATLLTIQRNLENAEDFYIVLGQKLNDTDVRLGSLVSDIHILGNPVVRKVGIYGRTGFVFLLGLLIGLVVGMVMAFLRDMAVDVVLDESTLPFPRDKVVVLPHFDTGDLLPYQMVQIDELDSTSPSLNEFRKLLFKLGMFDDIKEILAVTSTREGEGKTFVSANLAAAAAISGIPVLLIDGDVRVKGLSELFGMSDAKGYSDGHYEPYEIAPYLYILPVGSGKGDHLLIFKNMLEKISDLIERFRVVLDLPPITVSPEIKLLDRFAVKYILVLRYNYTTKEMLKKVDISPDLVIFNGKERATSYYSRYYSRYGRRNSKRWFDLRSLFEKFKHRFR
ncbi:MAG: hypothetical protein GXO39_00100 [Thermotogae bacterium]|nr:hypothetical protein [Thermotogota bacterium]